MEMQRFMRNDIMVLNSISGTLDQFYHIKKEIENHFHDKFKELCA